VVLQRFWKSKLLEIAAAAFATRDSTLHVARGLDANESSDASLIRDASRFNRAARVSETRSIKRVPQADSISIDFEIRGNSQRARASSWKESSVSVAIKLERPLESPQT